MSPCHGNSSFLVSPKEACLPTCANSQQQLPKAPHLASLPLLQLHGAVFSLHRSTGWATGLQLRQLDTHKSLWSGCPSLGGSLPHQRNIHTWPEAPSGFLFLAPPSPQGLSEAQAMKEGMTNSQNDEPLQNGISLQSAFRQFPPTGRSRKAGSVPPIAKEPSADRTPPPCGT